MALAVIRATVHLDDVESALEQADRGQESFALQSILIKVLRRAIRGCDHDDAAAQKVLEQSAEYHGVGDVEHQEFVETDDARAL